jgi:integrase
VVHNTKLRMSSFIQKRRNLYYARLRVPDDLKAHFKKTVLLKSLGTANKEEAQTRAYAVICRWRTQIKAARGSIDAIEKLAADIRVTPNPGDEPHPDFGMTGKDWAIENIADRLGSEEDEIRFRNIAMGRKTPFNTFLDRFLNDWDVKDKTKDMAASVINDLNKRFYSIESIKRPEVIALVREDKSSNSTKSKNYGFARQYWKYLEDLGVVDGTVRNPFSELGFKSSSKKSKAIHRQAFTKKDVETIYQKASERNDHILADLIALATYTGARIDELCELRVDDVVTEGGVQSLSIKDSKTQAGIRKVPVHPKIKPLVKRLVKDTNDEYLVTDQSENKYGSRSNAIGKRFGRLKTSLGYGEEFVFHSIRKTVVTLLENAGISEGVTADIVGHEKKTMTYGLYSAGTSDKKKLEAIKGLTILKSVN